MDDGNGRSEFEVLIVNGRGFCEQLRPSMGFTLDTGNTQKRKTAAELNRTFKEFGHES
jgi:hypothetical protein